MADGDGMSAREPPWSCILHIWDIFFCPSDHKSSLRSDSHGDNIFLHCLHPKTSLACLGTDCKSFPSLVLDVS